MGYDFPQGNFKRRDFPQGKFVRSSLFGPISRREISGGAHIRRSETDECPLSVFERDLAEGECSTRQGAHLWYRMGAEMRDGRLLAELRARADWTWNGLAAAAARQRARLIEALREARETR